MKAYFQVELSISHIQGSNSPQANAISCDQLSLIVFLTGSKGQAIAHISKFCIGGSASGTATRLDFASLGSTVQELFSAGLANSMLKSYKLGSTKYCNFCTAYKVPAFPATEKVVCSFVAKLYLEGVASGSMKTYLAAIQYLQIALGLGDPQMAHWLQPHYVVRREQLARGGIDSQ